MTSSNAVRMSRNLHVSLLLVIAVCINLTISSRLRHRAVAAKRQTKNIITTQNIIQRDVIRGDDVTMTCDVTSHDAKLSRDHVLVTWYRNGDVIERLDNSRMHVHRDRLTIKSVLVDDNGRYSCCVSRRRHDVTCANVTNLVVTISGSPPRWSSGVDLQVMSIIQLAGKTVILRCPAEGSPRPSIRWYKDGQEFTQRPIGKAKRVDRRYLLRLSDVNSLDSGDYTCVVFNKHGQLNWTRHLNVVARVNHPPIILEGPRNTTVELGGQVQFICRVLSDPQFFLQWVKFRQDNDTSYTRVNLTRNCHISQLPLQVSASAAQLPLSGSELTLMNVTSHDAGVYTCYVASILGTSQQSAWLYVIPRIPESALQDDIGDVRQMTSSVRVDALTVTLIICVVILSVTSSLLAGLVWCRRRVAGRPNAHRHTVLVTSQQNDVTSRLVPLPYDVTGSMCDYEIPVDPKWEIPRDSVKLVRVIGEGQFTVVQLGEICHINAVSDWSTVAVKTLLDTATVRAHSDFINDLETMKKVSCHDNVLRMVGCSTRKGSIWLVTDFAMYGNLRDFLRHHQTTSGLQNNNNGRRLPVKEACDVTLNYRDLLSFAVQASRGLRHLAAHQVVHRALCARNLLIADGHVIKVAEFGVGPRLLTDEDLNMTSSNDVEKARQRARWMSPELIVQRTCTTASDVWSYGVLAWEIFSLGVTPYVDVDTLDALMTQLNVGRRLSQPDGASDDVYSLMLDCWTSSPPRRPDFDRIVTVLQSF